MARKRNYDAAARPGPRYEGEPEVVHGGPFKPEKTKKLKQSTPDTRRKLAWRSQHGPE